MKRFVVGIDGGGTKTRAVAYEMAGVGAPTGLPIADAGAGPCNIAFMPLDDAVRSVEAAVEALGIDQALVASACAAVAGYSFRSRRDQFAERLRVLFPNAATRVAPDYFGAFRGALPGGRGILVVAGTGSIACGASVPGQVRRAGGYGYLIDDAGSGYGVGRAGIAAVMRAMDGTGPETSIAARLTEETGIGDWDGIIEAVYGSVIDRVRIASFSRCVAAASDDGDEVATRIMMRAGGALAKLAEAVHARTFVDRMSPSSDDEVLIARIGGLWKAGGALADVFERSCLRMAPSAVFVEPELGPAEGAALLAAEAAGMI